MNILSMDNKTAKNEKENIKINKFQVRYMLSTGLSINKAFGEQVESNMALTFRSKTMVYIRRVLRKDNACVI